jgi:hypothetical protein
VDFKKMWKQYKKIIVAAGFGMGLLSVLGYLPETIDLFKDYTVFVYGGVIAFGGFTFYKFYWNAAFNKPVAGYDRYVPNRNLGNPRYTDDVLRSRGVDPARAAKPLGDSFIMPEEDRLSRKPSRPRDGEVFDKFKQEY